MSTTIKECQGYCPIKEGILKYSERSSCQRYMDDCEDCEDWLTEATNDEQRSN